MKVYSTKLTEVKIIEYEQNEDNRGYSYPIYNRRELEKAGIYFEYCMEKVYCPKSAGTLYGIHFQNKPKAQTKLLYCMAGRGMDYAVDLRNYSKTYLQWVSVELSEENRKQIYIPEGFGHAFISLEDNTKIVMRYDEPFDERYSKQLRYDEPLIDIKYPFARPILAQHDLNAPFLRECDINL